MIRTTIKIEGTNEDIRLMVILKDGRKRVATVLKEGLSQREVSAAITTAVDEARALVARG